MSGEWEVFTLDSENHQSCIQFTQQRYEADRMLVLNDSYHYTVLRDVPDMLVVVTKHLLMIYMRKGEVK